ncbi:FG-GAP repeat domain-containing protein [Streptomyces sp. NPDC020681]|uniref:FG-GAP repeat domain-containing protein n=1 Tax=Streptomyces sp. NPDC020681 TaxID=3365083 RepID=UPI0037BD3CED
MAAGLVGAGTGTALAAPAGPAPAGSVVSVDAPDVPPNGSVTHTVTVHAAEKGQLQVSFEASEEQRWWDSSEEWTLGIGVSGTDDRCVYPPTLVAGSLTCELPPGDHTITYTTSASAGAEAWKVDVTAEFQDSKAQAEFTAAVGNPAPAMDYWLFARDGDGRLWSHGTSFGEWGSLDIEWRNWIADDWDRFDVLTKTSPVNVRGKGGDLVARDRAGHLWLYRVRPGDHVTLDKPVDVGGGWDQYTSIRGVGDVSGDGEPDLIARGSEGTLWLYRGTQLDATPFSARVKIGTGWNIYTSMTGGTDVTGDNRADLLARDASGGLWLYEGTGNATSPLKARVKVGSGWNIYNALVAYGDVTGDGHPELIARDSSGVLWRYAGTGKAASPFEARVKVTQYWDRYNTLI